MQHLSLQSKKYMTGFLLGLMFLMPYHSYAQTTWQPRTNAELIAYLYGIVVQLQAQLEALQAAENDNTRSSTRYVTTYRAYNPFFVNVVTLAPTAIGREAATLKAEADKGGSATIDVWFEYGEDKLSHKTTVQTISQNGRKSIVAELDNLDPDTTYDFRIVSEDEDGNRQYGQVRTFTTVASAHTQYFSGKPVAETEGAKNIGSSGAEISGFISMNDYGKGTAFFVYGSDRNSVLNADDFNSYKEIPVATGVISKSTVNTQFTGRNTVKTSAYGLKPATKYYYRACIEFSEDDDGIDPDVRCGDAESFTTLN